MAMTDQHFELFKKYIDVRIHELELKDDQALWQLIKLDWDILNDQPAMRVVVERAELAQLRALIDSEDIQRPARLARIAALEATT
jgi:hypothetical protein